MRIISKIVGVAAITLSLLLLMALFHSETLAADWPDVVIMLCSGIICFGYEDRK